MTGNRSLAAVMFTDAVSFSSHVGRDEEEAIQAIEEDFRLMTELCHEQSGQVIKSMGDGMLMLFPSAVNATQCAIEIQRRLGQRTWTHGGNPLLHRIGIHLCDVLVTESDILGDGVNVAARLEREAPPGGIAMSQATYDVVKSKLPIRANFVGERSLRNIAEPVRVYEIPPLFAPTPDQVLPAVSQKSPRDSEGANPLVAALVFVGVCVVAAAIIIYMKAGGGEPVAKDPKQVPISTPADPDTPGITNPRPSEPPPTGQGQTPVTPSFDRDAPETAFSDAEDALRTAYNAERERVRSQYAFGEMISWLEQQPWAGTTVGKAALEHWRRLESFQNEVVNRLAVTTAANPAEIPVDGGMTRIWPMDQGRYGVLNAAGTQEVKTILEFSAPELKALGEVLQIEASLQKAFAREYGL